MKKIALLNNRGFALVDEEDYKKLKSFGNWYNENGYAVCKVNTVTDKGKVIKRTVRMHRIVIDIDNGKEIDHINGNKSDNRKSNLRPSSRRENSRNVKKLTSNVKSFTSKFKGVFMRSANINRARPWQAEIVVNNKKIALGSFFTEIEAALTYNYNAKKYFGKFAWLNQIQGYMN